MASFAGQTLSFIDHATNCLARKSVLQANLSNKISVLSATKDITATLLLHVTFIRDLGPTGSDPGLFPQDYKAWRITSSVTQDGVLVLVSRG